MEKAILTGEDVEKGVNANMEKAISTGKDVEKEGKCKSGECNNC